jgi:CMP-N-acetylneuraminic acid synthetase
MNFFRGNLKAKNNKNLYMLYQGVLTKMETEFNKPIQYYLVFENDYVNVNQLLDTLHHIQL